MPFCTFSFLIPHVSFRHPLSADETAARKKQKADLEFKKKESERRKKKVSPEKEKPQAKGGGKAQPTKGQEKRPNSPDKGRASPEKTRPKSQEKTRPTKDDRSPSPDKEKDKEKEKDKDKDKEKDGPSPVNSQGRRKGKKSEPTIDEQIAALLPAEGKLFPISLLLIMNCILEIDGIWYVDGNRTLLSLNIRMNKITDKGAAAIIRIYNRSLCITLIDQQKI